MILLGGTGQVGTALRRLIPDAVVLGRGAIDLVDVSRGRAVDLLGPLANETLVSAAAYTAVDRAESDEETATRINGTAVGVLAEATAELGMRFVTYSTDYVFDGTADEPYLEPHATAPINAYGRSKRVGEELALAANPRSLIIRTSWVVSGTHRNFVSTVLDATADGPMAVVADQWGCPTIADDLAVATLTAVDAGVTGILHRTNTGATTWFHFARAVTELAGRDPGLVVPIGSGDYPTPARRPAYSVLGSEVAPAFGLSDLPAWTDSLRAVVTSLAAGGHRR